MFQTSKESVVAVVPNKHFDFKRPYGRGGGGLNRAFFTLEKPGNQTRDLLNLESAATTACVGESDVFLLR